MCSATTYKTLIFKNCRIISVRACNLADGDSAVGKFLQIHRLGMFSVFFFRWVQRPSEVNLRTHAQWNRKGRQRGGWGFVVRSVGLRPVLLLLLLLWFPLQWGVVPLQQKHPTKDDSQLGRVTNHCHSEAFTWFLLKICGCCCCCCFLIFTIISDSGSCSHMFTATLNLTVELSGSKTALISTFAAWHLKDQISLFNFRTSVHRAMLHYFFYNNFCSPLPPPKKKAPAN